MTTQKLLARWRAEGMAELKKLKPPTNIPRKSAGNRPEPSDHEWDFSKVDRRPETEQRIIFVWEFSREWFTRNFEFEREAESKGRLHRRRMPQQVSELLRAAFSCTGLSGMAWDDQIMKTPFLSLPESTQREIFVQCGELAMAIKSNSWGDKRLGIHARHIPAPTFAPTKEVRGRWRETLVQDQRKYRDEKWLKLRSEIEADHDSSSVRWLIARFDLGEHDDDLRARFDDWLRRARASAPIPAGKKMTVNRKGAGGCKKALSALGKYRIAVAYRRAFGVFPHQKVKTPSQRWVDLTNAFKQKSHFDQVEKSVSITLADLFG